MSRYTHIPSFVDFRGLDLRSSDVTRERGFSSDGTRNVMHTPQGGVMQRHGSKIIQKTYGGLGIFPFKQTNILGGERSEIVGFGADSAANSAKLYRLVESSFTLTNSHASNAATVSHFYDTSTSDFRFKITRGGSAILNHDLNIGTEGSPVFLSALETAVDALTSFSMSTPANASTTPAAFVQLMNEETIAANGGTLTVKYWYWEAINTNGSPSTRHPLINYAYETGLSSFENVSAVVLNNVLYISSGKRTGATINGNTPVKEFHVMKYDGQGFMAIGLPKSEAVAPSAGVAGSVTDVRGDFTLSGTIPDGHKYKFQQIFVDKAGNVTEGDISEDYTESSGADAGWNLTSLDVTGQHMAHGSAHRAHIASGTSGLTFTVDSGHTMVVGDIAYFWNVGVSRFIQREVTAVTSTTITVSATPIDTNPDSPNYDTGSQPQVAQHANITNNYRVRIWRTLEGGSEYYFLVDVPVSADAGSDEANWYDVVSDANLADNGAFIAPVYPRSRFGGDLVRAEGPCGRYLATFQTLLLVSGDTQRPNTVYFSDVDGPEYFPPGTHEFDLPEPVTGMAQCGEVLLVFSQTKTYAVTGSLSDFNFRVDCIAEGVGCTSHASIQKLDEGILAWQSARGPYISFGGRRVEPLGAKSYPDNTKVSRLEPFFTKVYSTGQDAPNFKRATSAVLPRERLYLLYVPYEDPDFPSYATSAGVLFVYDYGRDAWWKWDGWNCAGGMAVLDDNLYFAERSHDGAGTAYADAVVRLHQRQIALPRTNIATDGTKYNFADHNNSITTVFRSHWESLGRPSDFKRGLRCRLSSHETRVASSTEMTLKTYVDYDTALTSNNDTLTWTTQKDLKPKIKGEVCRAVMFEFGQSSLYYQPMLISGYEPEFTAGFRPGAGFKE